MALVGEAHVVVRALTDNVASDIQRGFSNSRTQNAASRAGQNLASSFSRGFNRNINANVFTRLSQALRATVPGAEAARAAFQRLVKVGYTLGTAIPGIVGGISSLIGGLGAIAGSAGGAIASVAALTGAVFTLGAALATIKLATGGIGRAVSLLNRGGGGGGGGGGGSTGGGGGGGGGVDPQIEADRREAANERVADAERALALVIERNRESLVDANEAVREAQVELNQAFLEGAEYIQQLGFDAEDAALQEKEAGLELARAREALARVQDLPPNSRARQQAELAYQQAELDYRRAKDKSSDLNKEQAKLAKTGVRGTEAVIRATENLADAEQDKARVMRDSMRDQIEAEEDLAEAIRDRGKAYQQAAAAAAGGGSSGGGGGGGIDPFEGLNDAQIAFAKFIASLKPKFDELSRIAAESFLPKLQQAIETLMGTPYDAVARGVGLVGSALGDASIELANMIAEAENISDLNEAFDLATDIIRQFGGVAANVWDILVTLIATTDDQLRRFVGWLEDQTGVFAKFLDTKQASGELQEFFKTSGDILARFGEIFGNTFNGLGAIIAANFSTDNSTGGGYLLNWLDRATKAFADLDASPAKAGQLKQYFLDVSVNAQKTLSSIGALIEEIIKIGDNPAIGQSFDILATGAGFVGSLLEKGINAGPVFSQLVVELTKFLDLMTDTGAIEIFFGTLRDILQVVNGILKNEIVMQILTVTGQVAAMLLAFNTVFKVVNFGFSALTGVIATFSGGLGSLIGGMDKLGGSAGNAGLKVGGFKGALGSVATLLTGPWGIAFAAAAGAMLILQAAIDDAKASSEELQNALINAHDAGDLLVKLDQGRIIKGFDAATLSAKDFQASLDLIAHNDFMRGFSNQASALKADLGRLGEELSTLSSTNLPAAQNAFRVMAEDMKLSKTEQLDLLNSMPAYKDALIQQATELGVNVTTSNEMTNNQRLLNLALGEGKSVTDQNAEALAAMSGKAVDTDGSIKTLADTIAGFASGQMNANETSRRYYETLETVNASVIEQQNAYIAAHGSLDGFRASMEVTDEQGRKNQEMLESMAKATLQNSSAVLEMTGSEHQASAAIEQGRRDLVNQMIQLGYTEAEANTYADTLGLIPGNVTTNFYANTEDAMNKIKLLGQRIDDINRRSVTATFGGGQFGLANGGLIGAYASGHITAAANGLSRMSQIRSGYKAGGGILWGEPTTGWEAYISGKSGQEERNRSILNEAARRLNLVPSGGGGVDVTVIVNPPPGASSMEIAEMVSRELSFQLRKGSV